MHVVLKKHVFYDFLITRKCFLVTGSIDYHNHSETFSIVKSHSIVSSVMQGLIRIGELHLDSKVLMSPPHIYEEIRLFLPFVYLLIESPWKMAEIQHIPLTMVKHTPSLPDK